MSTGSPLPLSGRAARSCNSPARRIATTSGSFNRSLRAAASASSDTPLEWPRVNGSFKSTMSPKARATESIASSGAEETDTGRRDLFGCARLQIHHFPEGARNRIDRVVRYLFPRLRFGQYERLQHVGRLELRQQHRAVFEEY